MSKVTYPRLSGSQRADAERDLKKLYGKPPYHGPTNYVQYDGYFASSIEHKYGLPIDELQRQTGIYP